jgi:hypothetical protein
MGSSTSSSFGMNTRVKQLEKDLTELKQQYHNSTKTSNRNSIPEYKV